MLWEEDLQKSCHLPFISPLSFFYSLTMIIVPYKALLQT